MSLENKIQDVIEAEIRGSEIDKREGTLIIDWDLITQKSHEEAFEYLREQITDAEDYDWLYDASTLVAFNEACRIIKEIRESKWCDDVISDTLSNEYDRHLLQKDPYAYYGAPRY